MDLTGPVGPAPELVLKVDFPQNKRPRRGSSQSCIGSRSSYDRERPRNQWFLQEADLFRQRSIRSAQAADEFHHKTHADVRLGPHKAPERPGSQCVASRWRRRHDIRGSRLLVNQGHFTKKITLLETRDCLALALHFHVPGGYQVEPYACLTLLYDSLFWLEGALHTLLCD